jgi:hypothetical protein
VRNMNALRTKLLRQALAQGAKPKLASGESGGRLVTPQRSGRAGKNERSFLAKIVVLLVLESEDSFTRETECSGHVRLETVPDLLLFDVEERLPVSRTGVEYADANRRVWPFGSNLLERLGE